MGQQGWESGQLGSGHFLLPWMLRVVAVYQLSPTLPPSTLWEALPALGLDGGCPPWLLGCQHEQGAIYRGLAMLGGHPSASREPASGCCWFTPRSKTCGSKQPYLQLGKASFPWLQSLAPFLPCLQTEWISQWSSLDMHPAWPRGLTQEHLRKEV